jgi:hypothetical protein
MQKVKN